MLIAGRLLRLGRRIAGLLSVLSRGRLLPVLAWRRLPRLLSVLSRGHMSGLNRRGSLLLRRITDDEYDSYNDPGNHQDAAQRHQHHDD